MSNSRMAWLIPALISLVLVGCAGTGSRSNASDAQSDAAKVNTELGSAYMQRGNHELALEKLNKALSFDSGYAPAYAVLGILYDRIGEPVQAGEFYQKAVKLDPKNASARNNYGRWLCSNGQAAQGMEQFAQVLDDPFYNNPLSAHANAGVCAMSLERYSVAEMHLRKALEINPVYADALYAMSDLSYKRQDYMRARAFLQRYEGVAGSRADSLLLGYRLESRIGDQQAAEQYAGRLRDRFPNSQEAKALQNNDNE